MGSAAAVWTLPPTWPVPREWDGGRCFVICTGASLTAQAHLVARLPGRIIAVKHAVLVRPNADVLFLSGEGTSEVAEKLIPAFTGTHIVVRGKSTPTLPERVKRVTRAKNHGALCELRDHVSGRDAGTSAINLAYHFGATEIVLLGYDMCGGHYCKHPLQFPPADHFRRHMEFLPQLAADAKAKGIRIVNCSPISRVTAFERAQIEEFL